MRPTCKDAGGACEAQEGFCAAVADVKSLGAIEAKDFAGDGLVFDRAAFCRRSSAVGDMGADNPCRVLVSVCFAAKGGCFFSRDRKSGADGKEFRAEEACWYMEAIEGRETLGDEEVATHGCGYYWCLLGPHVDVFDALDGTV